MKKRMLSILLIAGFAFAAVACGKDNAPTPTPDTQMNQEVDNSATDTESETDTNDVADTNDDTNTDTNDDTPSIPEGDTLGDSLAAVFREEAKSASSAADIAAALAEKAGYQCVVVDMEEGFLSGFDEDITGFHACTQFAPMISTIPFVGYVFEVEDPDTFKEKLEAVANPAWNICTEADQTVCEISGNYVFFVMCPISNQ